MIRYIVSFRSPDGHVVEFTVSTADGSSKAVAIAAFSQFCRKPEYEIGDVGLTVLGPLLTSRVAHQQLAPDELIDWREW